MFLSKAYHNTEGTLLFLFRYSCRALLTIDISFALFCLIQVELLLNIVFLSKAYHNTEASLCSVLFRLSSDYTHALNKINTALQSARENTKKVVVVVADDGGGSASNTDGHRAGVEFSRA